MEQLSVSTMSQLYLGNQALQGLMEEEEEGPVRTAQPLLIDVELSGSPSKPSLSFFHRPLLFHPLSLSFSFSPGPSLHSVQGLFWCQANTHTSKQQHAPSHRRTLIKTDTETDQRHKKRQNTHTHTHTHTHTRTQSEVSKGLAYLISIVIALSSRVKPLVWLHSDSQKR